MAHSGSGLRSGRDPSGQGLVERAVIGGRDLGAFGRVLDHVEGGDGGRRQCARAYPDRLREGRDPLDENPFEGVQRDASPVEVGEIVRGGAGDRDVRGRAPARTDGSRRPTGGSRR